MSACVTNPLCLKTVCLCLCMLCFTNIIKTLVLKLIISMYLTYLTYALSLQVQHRPQTTFHPFSSAFSHHLHLHQLYLNPAVPISHSRSLLQVFRGYPLPPWPCGFHCKACLAAYVHVTLEAAVAQELTLQLAD